MGTFKFSQHRLCPILGSKNLDKMGLDRMRSGLSFSYEDVLSYQVFSTRGLVLSWGVRSQTGAQNPIVQGGLVGTSPFFCFFLLLIFNFKNAFSIVQYKLAWHITTPPIFFALFLCNFFSKYDQLKYGTRRATS